MRPFLAVLRRELIALATRFSVYLAGAGVAAAAGFAVALGPAVRSGAADLSDAFAIWPWALALAAPALAAPSWGREAETGLREQLYAVPSASWILAAGRWAATYLVILLWLSVACLSAASLSLDGRLDWGRAAAGLKASAWAGAAYAAIAVAAGAAARSTTGAFLLGVGGCLAATAFGWTPARDAAALMVGERVADALAAASAPARLEAAQFGVLTGADGFYFASLAVLGVALGALALEARRGGFK